MNSSLKVLDIVVLEQMVIGWRLLKLNGWKFGLFRHHTFFHLPNIKIVMKDWMKFNLFCSQNTIWSILREKFSSFQNPWIVCLKTIGPQMKIVMFPLTVFKWYHLPYICLKIYCYRDFSINIPLNFTHGLIPKVINIKYIKKFHW